MPPLDMRRHLLPPARNSGAPSVTCRRSTLRFDWPGCGDSAGDDRQPDLVAATWRRSLARLKCFALRRASSVSTSWDFESEPRLPRRQSPRVRTQRILCSGIRSRLERLTFARCVPLTGCHASRTEYPMLLSRGPGGEWLCTRRCHDPRSRRPRPDPTRLRCIEARASCRQGRAARGETGPAFPRSRARRYVCHFRGASRGRPGVGGAARSDQGLR